jgi:hypothetical protein
MKRTSIIIGIAVIILLVVVLCWYFYSFNNSANIKSVSTTPIQSEPTSTPQAVSLSYEAHINLPNTLMLVDSQGRRAGEDPRNDTVFREIPGASGFGEDAKSGELDFSYPLESPFTLYVLGGQTGEYALDVWITNLGTQIPPQRISGTINAGSMIAYAPDYNLKNPASSTLVFQGVVSSTASITSVPPDNLPPPPVP